MSDKESKSIPVTLVGMMGAGKSEVGRRLANKLERRFVDSDQEIETRAGKTISAIFNEEGEKYFREMEAAVIAELLAHDDIVLATGGGAVTIPETLNGLKEKTLMVWLRARVDTLFERVKEDPSRPLLQQNDPRGVLENLLAVREDLYGQAHMAVDCDDKTPQEICDLIIERL